MISVRSGNKANTTNGDRELKLFIIGLNHVGSPFLSFFSFLTIDNGLLQHTELHERAFLC